MTGHLCRRASHVTRTLAVLADQRLRTARRDASGRCQPAPPASVSAVIDASKTSAPINPNLYGMFIEHAGSLVYRGMWAEMHRRSQVLQPHHPRDRRTAAARAAGPFGGPPRRWTPIGPAESVTHGRRDTPTSATTRPRSRSLQRASRHPPEGAGAPARQVLHRPHRPRRRSRRPGVGQPRLGKRRHGPPDADDRKADAAYATFPLAFKCPVDSDDGQHRDHRDRPRHPAHRRRVADARGQRRRLAARGRRRPEVASLGRLSLAGRQLRLRPRLARRDRRARPAPARSGTPSGAPCSPTTSAPTSS